MKTICDIYSPQVLFQQIDEVIIGCASSQKPVAIVTGYIDPYSETEERVKLSGCSKIGRLFVIFIT